MYRIKVNEMEAAGDGHIHFDCMIQKLVSEDPETWEMVPKGHRTLVLPSAALLAIRNGPGTNAEKRVAIRAVFLQKAQEWGMDESTEAVDFVHDLVPPDNWPVTVPWTPS